MTLKVNQLIGFGAGVNKLERVSLLDLIEQSQLSSGTQNISFSFNENIANATRRLFALSAHERDGTSPIAPTGVGFYNGSDLISADIHINAGAVSESRIHMVLASAIVPTNDYNQVRYSGMSNTANGGFKVAIVAVNFLQNSTPYDTDSDITHNNRTQASVSIDIPSNGLVLGASLTTSPSSVTWSPGTELADSGSNFVGLSVIGDGYVAEATGATYTVTRSGTDEVCAEILSWV